MNGEAEDEIQEKLERLAAKLDAEDAIAITQDVDDFSSVGIALSPDEARALAWPSLKYERMCRWIIEASALE